MSHPLSTPDVEAMLAALRKATLRDECWTCDCFQGFLTQMEMDSEPAAVEVLDPLKVPSSQMHGCLGCDPCPPAAAFAEYLRGVSQSTSDSARCNKGCSCEGRKE